MATLRSSIEEKFSAKYLFDPAREAWRSLVSPEEGPEEANEQPPLVPMTTMLGFIDITMHLTQTENAAKFEEVRAALEGSSLVEVVVDEQSVPSQLRRKKWLETSEDPAVRTIFAKPVHPDSTADQITAFFSKFGKVEDVQLRTFVDAAGTKRRPSVYVTFASEAEAKNCIASTPSYGSLDSDLANLYIPKLVIMTQRAHEEQAADNAQREHAQQQKRELVQAAQQQEQKAVAIHDGANKGSFNLSDTRKFLTGGRTCVINNVPSNSTWDTIKARLGGLSQDLPDLAGKITLVKVDEASQTGYVVLKTPKAAENLVLAYHRATGEYIEKIKTFVPNLHVATAEEDTFAIQNYPSWTKRKSDHKYQSNQRKRI